MNNIEIVGEKCTGCTTCYNICPVKAITMTEDKNGFKYPKINKEKCINCGKCYKKCPILSIDSINNQIPKKYCAFCTNNQETWKRSSSGGAFTEICNAYYKMISNNNINENCLYIYGASMNDKLEVNHTECTIDNIDILRKSKYIQSDLKDIFCKVKNRLDDGNYVIFSGTPCQAAGLKSFLGKEYEKLLLIDIACHGVGSKVIFDKCKNEIEKKYNKKLKNYEFRYKGFLATPDERHMIKYTFEDNTTKVDNNDIYMRLFLNELCLRKSCSYNCIFRTKKRYSDITIADFNGKSILLPSLYDKRNYSTIIFNSEKSLEVAKMIESMGKLIECNEEIIRKSNPILFENVSKNHYSQDNLIFNDIKDAEFNSILEKYSSKRIYWKKYIPYPLKYIINNLIIRRKNEK